MTRLLLARLSLALLLGVVLMTITACSAILGLPDENDLLPADGSTSGQPTTDGSSPVPTGSTTGTPPSPVADAASDADATSDGAVADVTTDAPLGETSAADALPDASSDAAPDAPAIPDSGTVDAGLPDSTVNDAQPTADTGTADSTVNDAQPTADTGTVDSTVNDAQPSADTGTADATPDVVADVQPPPDTGPPPSLVQITANGHGHVCARRSDGVVYCWGRNEAGQVAPASPSTPKTSPQVVYASPGVPLLGKDIATGSSTTCVHTANDQVTCWGGSNGYGSAVVWSLGRGPISANPNSALGLAAVSLAGPSAFTAGAGLGVGRAHACSAGAVANSLYCWGLNNSVQGGSSNASGPSLDYATFVTQPPQLGTIRGFGLSAHASCALADGGGGATKVYCWGSSCRGWTGVTSTDPNPNCSEGAGVGPTQVPGLSATVSSSIAAGPGHACAALDGRLYCWGVNNMFQLGRPWSDWGVAAVVPGLSSTNVLAVSCGFAHSCAIVGASANVVCFGTDINGATGGTSSGNDVPRTPVQNAAGPISGAVGVAAGEDFSCALTSAGEVYCWGSMAGNSVTAQKLTFPQP